MNILRLTSYKILMLLAIVIFIVFACSNEELDEDFLNHQGLIENEAPIAVAEATPLSGDIPLDVDFTGNNSSDDFRISNYFWNFNDGTTSDDPDPSHMFKSVGRHIVKLTVEDELGLKHTDTIIITVDDSNEIAPKAIISADPPSGIAPLEVEFSGSNSTDDEEVSNYFWEFKDGSTSNKAIVSHTFDSIGAFYVKLTVKDEMGLTHKDSIAINVKEWENGAPIALANASPLAGTVPLNVSFTGSNSTGDSDIVSYTWDFKDGSTSDKADVQHTFETVGVYNVELTVRDEIGLTQKDSISIIVNEPDNEFPLAVPSASPLTGTVPLEVSFTGSNSTDDNGIEKYVWDFKDGSTSNKADVQHIFETAGTYDVQLRVEDEMGLEHQEELTITVNAPDNEPPVAVPSASPLTGTVPLEVNFTGSNSTDDNGIEKYVWDFKDGSTSNQADVQHTFEREGTYDVELTVEDEMGLEHKRKLTIIVNEPNNEPPVAVPSASPLTGTVPLEVSFTGSNSTDDNGIDKYAWDFKDGSTSNQADVQHTFETVGTYDVELTVEDEMGLEHQEELTITVNAPDNEPPVAVPSASPLTGTVPLEVSFTGSNSTDDNGIEKYAWDFKDGSTSNQADVQHTFETAGTYDVELTVEDEMGLEHQEELTITVNAPDNEPPVAVPSASPLTGRVPLEVSFTGSNSTDDNGIEKYAWDFKDGSTSNKVDVQHTFEMAGTYEVELTVEDEMGLKHKRELTITVSELENEGPVAVANASPLMGTLPLEVSFTGSDSTDDNGIETYSWNFKDGSSSNIANPTHTFNEAGTYDVELTVEDGMGLTNKGSVTITVSVPENEAPVAVANASPLSGTLPLEVSFTGSNSTDDNGIETYSWNFKDGSSSNIANPIHTFNEAETYDVELTVEDESGLSHKTSVTITVSVPENEAPVAVVKASPLSGTLPLEVSFTGSDSTDDNGIETYSWNFKDGSSSNIANPTHTFNEAGTYDVELTVEDGMGLTNNKSVAITVSEPENEAPVAVASASPRSGSVPLQVSFTGGNSSDDNGIESYSWDFKDGSSSNNANPSHTFNDVGTYNVELTVEDESGLSHKASVMITVDPPPNQAPNAVIDASPQSGEAPLQVNFTSSNSTDDKDIVGYLWNIPGNMSSSPNVTHTFNEPGIYNVSLTVNDAEGLQDTATVTINVTESQTGGGQIPCSTGGGRANETGAKIWCWENIDVPSGASSGTTSFSNGQLALNIECSANQVVREGKRLKFSLNPTSPSPASWCNNDFNMRSEIRTMPWNVDHQVGTEEWFGFSYTFGNNYKIDTTGNWLFWQVHENTIGASPLLSLQIDGRQASSLALGELMLSNTSQPIGNNNNSNYGTGIVPVAGQKLDIVIHVIWGDDATGLWQVWVDGVKVHDVQAKTVRAADPVGGNAKWGIYKHKWRNQSGVDASADIGITNLETYMGSLRMITRRPGDSNYLQDSYNEVAPD